MKILMPVSGTLRRDVRVPVWLGTQSWYLVIETLGAIFRMEWGTMSLGEIGTVFRAAQRKADCKVASDSGSDKHSFESSPLRVGGGGRTEGRRRRGR